MVALYHVLMLLDYTSDKLPRQGKGGELYQEIRALLLKWMDWVEENQ